MDHARSLASYRHLHYARGCNRYASACGNCPLLPNKGSKNDLSAKIFRRKKELYHRGAISFVTCSRWLERQAKGSGLFVGQRITNIPNPIDTHVFCPQNQAEARLRAGLPADKHIILFVSQRVTDGRKGMRYFIEAIDRLVARYPEMKENTAIAILGGHSEEVNLTLPSYSLGYVSDEKQIVAIYNSADAFVLPSLEDNLPNTIMESMACGVPSIGFRVGGIPEMIDHQQNATYQLPRYRRPGEWHPLGTRRGRQGGSEAGMSAEGSTELFAACRSIEIY